MQTVEELIDRLKQENAHNLMIIGPYTGSYEIMTEEEAQAFNLRNLVKDKAGFFNAYNKVVTATDQMTHLLKAMESWLTTLYAQTLNPLFKPSFAPESGIETIMLKGDAMHFECASCHKAYTYEQVIVEKHYHCTCGRHIRPMCLLTGEKYDLAKIEAFEDALLKATTIFLVGFDFNEVELCKQLEVIAAKKSSGDTRMPTVVVVGECDKEAVYETFRPEFIVDEKPETALERLLIHFANKPLE